MRGLLCLLMATAWCAADELPLHAASAAGDLDAMKAALAAGASIDARDESGRTALHIAAEAGRDDVTRFLVQAGARVNAIAGNGDSPADRAAEKGNTAVRAILVEAGGIEVRPQVACMLAREGTGWMEAAEKIASCGPEVLPPLFERAKGFRHAWEEVRFASVLWHWGPSLAPELRARLASEHRGIRNSAAWSLAAWPCIDDAPLAEALDLLQSEVGDPDTYRRFAVLAWRHPAIVRRLPSKSKAALCRSLERALDAEGTPLHHASLFAAAACGSELKEQGAPLIALLKSLGDAKSKRPVLAPQARWTLAAITTARGVIANPYGRSARAAEDEFERRDEAIGRAVQWLLAKQAADGSWAANTRWPQFDVGVTALAILSLLGTEAEDPFAHSSPLAAPLRRGLAYLLHAQNEDGLIGDRSAHHFVYGHAIATMAIADALIQGGPPGLLDPLGAAVAFIQDARNPHLAWRYGVRPKENDTSVTRWMFEALRLAWFAGVPVDGRAFTGARRFVDRMTDPYTGVVGYNVVGAPSSRIDGRQVAFPPEKTRAMTAAGITMMLLDDATTVILKDPLLVRLGSRCLDRPPRWDEREGTIDFYYWYLGSDAMALMGQSYRNKWDQALRNAVLPNQAPDGSWPAVDPWSPEGGPVYATAILAMSLQAAYRHR